MADVKLIKQLREMTQAGFVDCKNALEQNKGDLNAAVKYLREKGLAKAAKKAGAIAAEGAIVARINEKCAVIAEINSQTDFAAKNEGFVKLCDQVANALLDSSIMDIDSANNLKMDNGDTIGYACDQLSAKIGEKIAVRRLGRLVKGEGQDVGCYQHANKKYGAICLFDKPVADDVKKKICMHIVARNPKFINKTQVDSNWLEAEKGIIQATAGNKPLQFLQKVIEGRLNKRLAEVCLENQEYDFEPGVTVGQVLNGLGVKLLSFARYEVGEGIEKKQSDFAAEVAEQMQGK